MIEIKRYRLDFKGSFVTSQRAYRFREGLILVYTDDNHKRFYSEISPLPGFSDLDISDYEYQIADLSKELNHKFDRASRILRSRVSDDDLSVKLAHDLSDDEKNDAQANSPTHDIGICQSLYNKLPELCDDLIVLDPQYAGTHLRFAVSSILLQVFLWYTSTPNVSRTISINGNASSLDIVNTLVDHDFETIKFKVGSDHDRELALIKETRRLYPDVNIRLDANGAWNVDIAMKNLSDYSELNIEYIEQPVPHSELLSYGSILRKLGIKVAADESARNLDTILQLTANQSIDHVILKPAMIGSLKEIADLVKIIRDSGLTITFTTSLDSGINRMITAYITSLFDDRTHAHGLATGALFNNDILDDSSLIHLGKYTISDQWMRNIDVMVDETQLTEVN